MRDYVLSKANTPEKIWELFRYFRSEIQYEHQMLMGRVTWFITCQSFLVAAYTVSYTRLGQPNWFSNRALPVLAVMISFLAYFMIEGAANTIDQWNGLRRSLVNVAAGSAHGMDSILIRRWRSGSHRWDFVHMSALWFPRLIPFVFMVFWLVISIQSQMRPWIQPGS
jgi:hypothetical protein